MKQEKMKGDAKGATEKMKRTKMMNLRDEKDEEGTSEKIKKIMKMHLRR